MTKPILVRHIDGEWQHKEINASYEELNKFFISGDARTSLPNATERDIIFLMEGTVFADNTPLPSYVDTKCFGD
jgi:hypothetical protein